MHSDTKRLEFIQNKIKEILSRKQLKTNPKIIAVTKISHPTVFTYPKFAENVIGTAQPNATPKNSCGAEIILFRNGYTVVMSAPTRARSFVEVFKKNKRLNAIAMSNINSFLPSRTETFPDAIGRSLVLFTKGSIFLSAISFSTHPAERIIMTPIKKTINRVLLT